VWVDFAPQTGHEQAVRRPALILTPDGYNRKTGMAIACPITSHSKGYPFEVALPNGLPISGFVLADHVRSIDWRARRARRIAGAGAETLSEVLGKLCALLGIGDRG